jgi:lipopolysaccharide/colanic/teichoic acid biosynthesis glycosyltransferase
LKRVFDVVTAGLGLIALLPILGLIAVVIRVTSAGPVFYGSTRIGRGGKPFKMIKFRTMVVGADKIGPLITAGNDPRITPIGRTLRHTKLDELPTLWNVLKGDMSIVGPRPENPESASLYTETQKNIWTLRPGITSMATLKYRHEESLLACRPDLETAYFQIMQDKLALELAYVNRQTFWLDMRIIFRTLVEVFR